MEASVFQKQKLPKVSNNKVLNYTLDIYYTVSLKLLK